MEEKKTTHKKIQKKHQPRGLSILFEDKEIIVVNKVEGLLTIGTMRERERTAQYLLDNYVKKGNSRSRNRVFIVHRLDRETSGILVFAKSERSKHFLQNNWPDFTKKYLALVHGQLREKDGVITSFLAENNAYRVFSTNDENTGRYAKTAYKVLKQSTDTSLIEIILHTGRKHQIRVHLSENGNPVVGDRMYGPQTKKAKRLMLHSASLSIIHPVTHREMTFKTGFPPSFK